MIARINLAPEVYQNSQRSKQRKRVATTLGAISCGVMGALIGVFLLIYGGQKVFLVTVNSDIKKYQDQITKMDPELTKAVTAQQHVKSVVSLYGKRVYISQFFKDLERITPVGVALESIAIGTANDVTLTANGGSFKLADKFVKAIQADNVEIGANPALSNTPYFSSINLSSVDSGTDGKVQFKITAQMATDVTSAPKTSASTGGFNGR